MLNVQKCLCMRVCVCVCVCVCVHEDHHPCAEAEENFVESVFSTLM